MMCFAEKIVSLSVIIYSMTMRNRIILTIALLCSVAVGNRAAAQVVELHDDMSHIEDMMQRNRWADASVEIAAFLEGLSPSHNHFEREWAEYQAVRCALGLGDRGAESRMLSYIEEYPEGYYTNRTRFLLASYYADNRRPEEARAIFREVSYKALDSVEKERYDIRMGYICFSNGEYREAERYLERIPKKSNYYGHAQYYMAYIDYVEGRNAEARKVFASLRDHDSYRLLIPYYLLQIDYREGNYDSVIREGEKLLDSAMPAVRSNLLRIVAEAYYIRGDYAQALRYISEYPASMRGRQENYIRGYSLYRLGRYSDAIEPLKSVCGADDELTQNASYHLGDCYLRSGDKSHAADAFAMASVDGYNDKIARDALLNYGRLKYEMGGGRFNEAVNILNDYLQRYPGSEHEAEVKQMLIATYYNSHDYDTAYAAIRQFDNPDREIRAAHQKVALFCAVKAVERGELQRADELLAEAASIGLTPKYNALALYWQGEVAAAQGDMKRAGECYEAYLRRAPKSEAEYAFAHYGMGYVRFAEGDMKAAATSFDNFSRAYNKRDGYLFDAMSRLGDAHYAMRDFTRARNAYNVVSDCSSIERNYADFQLAMIDGVEARTLSKIDRLRNLVNRREGDYIDDAWYELGHTYITSERYSDAALTLQQFVHDYTTSPYYISALSELGLAYFNLERRDDARRCYKEVVAYDPQSSAAMEAMRGIREIYVAEGNVDEYFAYAERSGVQSDMSVAARDSLTFVVARMAYLDGRMSDAREKLEDYLVKFEKGYNRSEALFYMIDCHIQSGDNKLAMEAMDELLAQGSLQYRERVLRVMAPMASDEGDFVRSAESYRLLCDEALEAAVRSDASEGYVMAALRSEDEKIIAAMCDYIVSMPEATAWAQRQAKLNKANMLTESGDTAEATKIYEELAQDITTDEGAESYYNLVADKYRAGDYASVEQMIYNMGECGSMYWQAKLFLLLGDALVQMGNTFQARATYQSIADGYTPNNDGIVDEARQRIANL